LSSLAVRTFVANGPVSAVLRSGDSIYLGGRFNRIGPRTGPGVEVSLDGSQIAGLPEFAGAGPAQFNGSGGMVSSVVSDGSGGWYVGGLFSHVGAVPRTNLAHIRADRSVDPVFAPTLDAQVQTMVLSGSTLYVAGPFTSIGGQARNRIAALNVTDGSVTAFNPNADGPVSALALSADGSILYAGGRFTTIGGLPRLSIAALSTATGAATPTFNPSTTGTVGGGRVDALARSGSTLYVGGTFSSIGGALRHNIAALSLGAPTDGAPIAAFNANPSQGTCTACASISALTVAGPTVYAAGSFTTIGGQPRARLAGLNAADGLATAFNPNPDGTIFTLLVAGPLLYVGGSFRSIGGQPRNNAASVGLVDGVPTAFNPDTNNSVQTVAVAGSAVFLGGYFSSLGGVVRHSLAALSALDGTVTDFNPNPGGVNGGTPLVSALAVSGTTIYAGGNFASMGGQARASLAAMDAASGSVTSWDPGARYGTSPGSVESLAVSGDVIYVGGTFNKVGSEVRSSLAAVSATDGATTPWNPYPNSAVDEVVVAGDLVYVAGYFTTIGGQTRNKVAALRTSDGTATSWNPDATAQANVLALAVSGSTVYLGGNFTSIGGIPRKNIAAVTIADGTTTSFDPTASDPMSGGGVHSLAVHGDTVYAAGFFSLLGGQTRHLIGAVDAVTGSATSFNPHGAPGFGAFDLDLAPDGTLYAAGSFLTLDRAFQQGFAQFSAETDPIPVVPEGAPWLLVAVGVGLASVLARRRRTAFAS